MKVFILGVGDAFSSKNYSTCFVIKEKNNVLAIECPHPYLKILEDVRKKIDSSILHLKVLRRATNLLPEIKDIDNFIITHLHADHCSGLETMAFYKKFVEGKKLNLSVLQDIMPLLRHSIDLNEYINFIPHKGKQDNYFSYINGFLVEKKITNHYIPATALLITGINGKRVAFSADTAFDRDLIDWLNQADIIIHETGPAPGHAPLEDLLSLPSNIKDKMRIIHYSDSIEKKGFRFLRQGEILNLGEPDEKY